MNTLPNQSASDPHIGVLVGLVLEIRTPSTPDEVILAKQIKEIHEKGRAIEIPDEFI